MLVAIQCALAMASLVFGAGKDADLVPTNDIKPMMRVRSVALYASFGPERKLTPVVQIVLRSQPSLLCRGAVWRQDLFDPPHHGFVPKVVQDILGVIRRFRNREHHCCCRRLHNFRVQQQKPCMFLNILQRYVSLTISKIPRWVFITVLDIATELVITILPCFPLRSIRMHLYDKFKVMLSFSTRLLVIAFSILSIWAISFAVSDPTRSEKSKLEKVDSMM